jgi:hypothetical protein
MSKKEQQFVTVYAITHAADWLINHEGRKHNLPQWQVELLKLGVSVVITAAM